MSVVLAASLWTASGCGFVPLVRRIVQKGLNTEAAEMHQQIAYLPPPPIYSAGGVRTGKRKAHSHALERLSSSSLSLDHRSLDELSVRAIDASRGSQGLRGSRASRSTESESGRGSRLEVLGRV